MVRILKNLREIDLPEGAGGTQPDLRGGGTTESSTAAILRVEVEIKGDR